MDGEPHFLPPCTALTFPPNTDRGKKNLPSAEGLSCAFPLRLGGGEDPSSAICAPEAAPLENIDGWGRGAEKPGLFPGRPVLPSPFPLSNVKNQPDPSDRRLPSFNG